MKFQWGWCKWTWGFSKVRSLLWINSWTSEELMGQERKKVKSLSLVLLFATPWTVACTRLLRPWDFLGKSTGVCCHFLLQGIFPTQGLNPGLPHCRQTLYRLSHRGSRLVRSSLNHLGQTIESRGSEDSSQWGHTMEKLLLTYWNNTQLKSF